MRLQSVQSELVGGRNLCEAVRKKVAIAIE